MESLYVCDNNYIFDWETDDFRNVKLPIIDKATGSPKIFFVFFGIAILITIFTLWIFQLNTVPPAGLHWNHYVSIPLFILTFLLFFFGIFSLNSWCTQITGTEIIYSSSKLLLPIKERWREPQPNYTTIVQEDSVDEQNKFVEYNIYLKNKSNSNRHIHLASSFSPEGLSEFLRHFSELLNLPHEHIRLNIYEHDET